MYLVFNVFKPFRSINILYIYIYYCIFIYLDDDFLAKNMSLRSSFASTAAPGSTLGTSGVHQRLPGRPVWSVAVFCDGDRIAQGWGQWVLPIGGLGFGGVIPIYCCSYTRMSDMIFEHKRLFIPLVAWGICPSIEHICSARFQPPSWMTMALRSECTRRVQSCLRGIVCMQACMRYDYVSQQRNSAHSDSGLRHWQHWHCHDFDWEQPSLSPVQMTYFMSFM